ncbi:MAG: META domain-containing protein [Filomicrobium sp.]
MTMVIVAVSVLAIAGCDATNSANQLTDLTETSWKVEGIPKQVTATMSFGADGRVTGSAGCNRYFGTYKTSGQTIEISGIGSTRKMCPDVEMSVETELLKSLAVVNRWQVTSDKLKLTGPVDTTLVRLRRVK